MDSLRWLKKHPIALLAYIPIVAIIAFFVFLAVTTWGEEPSPKCPPGYYEVCSGAAFDYNPTIICECVPY